MAQFRNQPTWCVGDNMEATTSGNDQSSIVEVLFEFKESRKPLSIPRDALLQRVERELALCVGDACLLPPGMNLSDVASSSKKSFFLLQRWSQKWNAFIDVASVEDVKDADKITVVPAFAPACGVSSRWLFTCVAMSRSMYYLSRRRM